MSKVKSKMTGFVFFLPRFGKLTIAKAKQYFHKIMQLVKQYSRRRAEKSTESFV